jgi:translation elongation factor EF-G
LSVFIVNYLPSPVGVKTISATNSVQVGEAVQGLVSTVDPLSVFVFKTLADRFAGRLSFLTVFTGLV